MGSLVTTKVSSLGNTKVEVNINELTLRLKSLKNVHDLEIIQLTILSMLEEIGDATGDISG
jgi:hypothetical protein